MKVLRVIDFETTGLPSPKAAVIEVGWTDVFLDQTVSMEPMWHGELCNPNTPIEVGAQAVHHISQDELEGCRHPKEVLEEITEGADYFVAHNHKFETFFFRPPGKPWICTLKASRHFILDAPSYSNQVLRYHLNLDGIKGFDKALAFPPHRAGPDTYVTAYLLIDLLKRASVDQLVAVTDQPTILRQVVFGKYKGRDWSQVPKDYCAWLKDQSNVQEDVLDTIKHYHPELFPDD